MPRAGRALGRPRNFARRRHRSWMLSMTLASFGWGTWWVLLLVEKLFGTRPDSLVLPGFVSSAFAVAGLAVAVWCFRARRSWLFFVMVPFFANLSLLFVPWLAEELAGRRG